MARGFTDPTSGEAAGETTGKSGSTAAATGGRGSRSAARAAAKAEASGAPPTSSFEEAWNGWIKPVGGIVVVVAAYLLYTGGMLPELPAGRVLLAVVIGGAIYLGVEPALQRAPSASARYLLIGFAVVWAAVTLGPLLPTLVPGKIIGEATLTREAPGAVINVEGGGQSAYLVSIFGRLRGSGEVTAAYEVSLGGDGESSAVVSGELKREVFNQRVSRRSGATVAVQHEETESIHRVSGLQGATIKVSGDIGSEALEDGLHLALRRAGPNPMIFFGLGLVLFVVGVVVDFRLASTRAERTHLATATAFTLVFAARYAMVATPHSMVRQAFDALLLALLFGALLGWGVSAIVNSFRPRPKKLAGTRNKFADDE